MQENTAQRLTIAFLDRLCAHAQGASTPPSPLLETARLATGQPLTDEDVTRVTGILQAAQERLPLSAPPEGPLYTAHPLAGAGEAAGATLDRPDWSGPELQTVIEQVCGPVQTPEHRYLALWRCLPGQLEQHLAPRHPQLARLPADPSTPDQPIWACADASAALAAATDQTGAALLLFSLSPVQSFIQAARSVRDLWTGSTLLSWLTFQAMEPVLARISHR